MSRRKLYLGLVAALVAGSCWMGSAVAQDRGGGEGDRRGGDRRGGDRRGGNRDPEEMRKRFEEFRKRMSDRMREQLGASEDEWKVLQPRIEKVQTLQRQSRGTRFGMFGGRTRGRRPGGDRQEGQADENQPDIQKKSQALRNILEDKASQAGAIKAALDAYRKARDKSALELATARKQLREVVSVRQEAQLVLMGILE